MSVPERYLVLEANDPAGDVAWALFPLDDATLDRLHIAFATLKTLRKDHPNLHTTEIAGYFAPVCYVSTTASMEAYVSGFAVADLHRALVDHLTAAEEPTVSDHHLLSSLLAPVGQTTVSVGAHGTITTRTYWSEEGDDITASTDLLALEREALRR